MLTGEGVLCRVGLLCMVGVLTEYSLIGGKRFGKSGILFYNGIEGLAKNKKGS